MIKMLHQLLEIQVLVLQFQKLGAVPHLMNLLIKLLNRELLL
jgi:hypothetical protein